MKVYVLSATDGEDGFQEIRVFGSFSGAVKQVLSMAGASEFGEVEAVRQEIDATGKWTGEDGTVYGITEHELEQ